MHKQIVTIVLALAITSILSAQESTDKTIMIGTDLAPLAFGAPNGYFGLFITKSTNPNSVFISEETPKYRLDSDNFLKLTSL